MRSTQNGPNVWTVLTGGKCLDVYLKRIFVVVVVVVQGKGMIRDKARAIDDMKNEKYDSDYYINNQLVPAVEGILSVFGHEKNEIISEKTQSNLGKFL